MGINKLKRPGAVFVLSFALAATMHAAPVSVPAGTSEIPGVQLSPGSVNLSGTVVATNEDAFLSPVTGTLRSMVVNTGGGFDFYFQVLNNTPGGANNGNDIFRFSVSGFYSGGADPVFATFRTDGLAGLDFTGVGGIPAGWLSTQITNKGANGEIYSADRDPALAGDGGFGFDFDPSQFINFGAPGDPTTTPQNIDAGERSNWIVIRTAASTYAPGSVQILGPGTATATGFKPVPEPSAAIFLLLSFGIVPVRALLRRRKRNL